MDRKNAIQMKLKETMTKMLDSKRFEQITVSDLCRAAGTSRVTFYTYYDDKYSLLDDYFRDMLEKAEGDFTKL